jgi:lipopolysaccharide biosynthesis glycosyltransferase
VSIQRATEAFYITDAGFAVPTLVSIESLRRWRSASNMKINVVLLDMSQERINAFTYLGQDLSLQIHSLRTDAIASLDNERFNPTHVPLATVARFLIHEFFRNEDYDILYVDGDTLFIQDPGELLDLPAPEAGLLAAEDQSYFYANDHGKTGKNIRSYFANIGVKTNQGYFNAGVLKFRTREWIKISKDCLSFLEENLSICQYHDQSSLNAIVGNKRIRLSPVWNFKPSYWNWGVSEIAEPKLLHFVGGDKPWMGNLKVWSKLYPEYIAAVERRSHKSFLLREWTEEEQAARRRSELFQQIKDNTIFLGRKARRRAMLRDLIETSVPCGKGPSRSSEPR